MSVSESLYGWLQKGDWLTFTGRRVEISDSNLKVIINVIFALDETQIGLRII